METQQKPAMPGLQATERGPALPSGLFLMWSRRTLKASGEPGGKPATLVMG